MDFISKNEKRIVSNKKRLEAEESPELEQKAKEIHEVGIQIGEKLAKAEALGECAYVCTCIHTYVYVCMQCDMCTWWCVGGRVFTDVAASGWIDVLVVLTPLTQDCTSGG